MSGSSETVPGRRRLRAIAGHVPRGAHVVDVGSDHGRLPRMLLSDGQARACIATERRAGGILEALAASADRDPRLEIRFGDGLDALRPDDPVEVVSIAGMGARTIAGILDRGRDALRTATRLILQPQSEWPRLRRWLRTHGFRAVDEELIEDREHLYLVVVAEPGAPLEPTFGGLSADDLDEAGAILLERRPAAAVAYWRERERRAGRSLRQCVARGGGGAAVLEERLRQTRRILTAFETPESTD